MKHQKAYRKLGRTPTHRRAMFRNMATSLILNEKIETTLPKAKELKRVADKLITLGKKNNLHARRQALSFLTPVYRRVTGYPFKDSAVHKLFTDLSPRYMERSGGYTRVIRTRKRPGDMAQLAIIQFVEGSVQKKEKKKRRVVRAKRTDESQGKGESN
jgi:large subunit ribosomal protein L17